MDSKKVHELFRVTQAISSNSHLPRAALQEAAKSLQSIIGAERAVGLVLCLPTIVSDGAADAPKPRPRSARSASPGAPAKARKRIHSVQHTPTPEALFYEMSGWSGNQEQQSKEWWSRKGQVLLSDPILRHIASPRFSTRFSAGFRATLKLRPGEWEQSADRAPRGLGDVSDVLWTGVGVGSDDHKFGFALYRLGTDRFTETDLELARVFSGLLAGSGICRLLLDKRGATVFKGFSSPRLRHLALFREGMDPVEIAKDVECTPENVRKTLRMAQKRLEVHYPDLGQDKALLRRFLMGRPPLE